MARKKPSAGRSRGYSRVFISYSHTDVAWMELFRRELNGALFNRATVWSDKDIGRGTDWEARLDAELDQADVALILATTDYLQSKWCRRELKFVCDKLRQKRISRVFWVEVKPCAWKQTELAALQRSGSKGPLVSLEEIADENERSREIVRIVEDICVAVEESAAGQKSEVLTVKAILGDEAFKRHLRVERVTGGKPDFAIVCRGRDGSDRDVAIKVVRRGAVRGILDNLGKVAERRKNLIDPGFIRLYESFVVTGPYGDHLVLVMEYFEGQSLRDLLNDGKFRKQYGVDRLVTLARRAAEALKDFHRVEYGDGTRPIKGLGLGFGPMIPEHLFYDPRLDRLRFSALSISNFAWDVLGWKKFATLVDGRSERYAAPEQVQVERAVSRIDKRKTDQYMLGQLIVELLDGRLQLGKGVKKDEIDRKAALFDEPLRYAGGWTSSHPQLEQIVSKMLARDPDQRWGDMDQVATALKTVESNQRALAKASYRTFIEPDTRFFTDFYRRFFATPVAKRAGSLGKFTNRKEQHDKLRKGMAAVLNFYPGNEPTSLRYVIDVHRDKKVTDAELKQFSATFLKLLSERLNRKITGTGGSARKKEIMDAWAALFDQVLKHFREEGLTRDAR